MSTRPIALLIVGLTLTVIIHNHVMESIAAVQIIGTHCHKVHNTKSYLRFPIMARY